MTLFAITLPSVLLPVGATTFTLYVLLSFVAVAKCALRKNAAGRLINGRAAPVSLSIPPSGAWLFSYNFLALVFAQFLLYLAFTQGRTHALEILVGHDETRTVTDWHRIIISLSGYLTAIMLIALAIVFVGSKSMTGKVTILPRAGACFFIVNVLALLWLQSPLYMVLVVMGQSVLLLENCRTAQKQFGLDRLTVMQLVKWSVLICGAVIVVAAPVMQLFQFALDALHLSHPEQASVEDFRQVKQTSQIIDFLIQAVLIAPMIEELFFRGFLLTYLKTHLSTWGAILISGAVFAIAHQNLDSVLPLWILGIVLGVAYEHTGSILLPMGIHACFNFITALTLLAQRASS